MLLNFPHQKSLDYVWCQKFTKFLWIGSMCGSVYKLEVPYKHPHGLLLWSVLGYSSRTRRHLKKCSVFFQTELRWLIGQCWWVDSPLPSGFHGPFHALSRCAVSHRWSCIERQTVDTTRTRGSNLGSKFLRVIASSTSAVVKSSLVRAVSTTD